MQIRKLSSELLTLNLHFNKVPSASPVHMEVLEALITMVSNFSEHPNFTVGSLLKKKKNKKATTTLGSTLKFSVLHYRGGAWKFACLTSSEMMPMLLGLELHFGELLI